jgi:hypothetical protein
MRTGVTLDRKLTDQQGNDRSRREPEKGIQRATGCPIFILEVARTDPNVWLVRLF